MKDIIVARLKELRKNMQKNGIDAYLINGSDPHLSEYMPEHWQSRSFISGFTGSYGWLAFTQNEAVLWTDSRYFLQAETELEGTGIQMLKARLPESITTEKWLASKINYGDVLAFDASCYSIGEVKAIEGEMLMKGVNIQYDVDLLNEIWDDRPTIPLNELSDYPVENAGISRIEKIETIRKQIIQHKCRATILAALDDIAWTFNVRGSDVECNPVALAYAYISSKSAILFVDFEKLDDEIRQNLIADGIELKEYTAFYPFLSSINQTEILVDINRTNALIVRDLNENNSIHYGISIPTMLKARKNATEISGFKKAMIADGLALLDFQLWLEKSLDSSISEYDVAEKLSYFRSQQKGYIGTSFFPIVGYKDHGAIVHFHVSPETANTIEKEGILLFDSGGQYDMGTTDITRTIKLGNVSAQSKIDFTLVLKGMITLSDVQFMKGTTGCHLDILARHALWQEGLNYGHGTGHGVGARLNVHEGPMAIRQDLVNIAIEPGMVLSNEPGLYRENEYGIRIENLIVCVEKETTQFGTFYGFDTLTLYPIDTTLIELDLLTKKEINWINNYHQMVQRKLSKHANSEQLVLLHRLTQAI